MISQHRVSQFAALIFIGLFICNIIFCLLGCSNDLGDAAEKRDLNKVKSLIEKGEDVNGVNNNGQSILWRAVKGGDIEIVKYLVNHGADLLQQDQYVGTPLHLAAAEGRNDIVVYLLKQGVDVNIPSVRLNDTPLWHAVRWEHPETVKVLLEHGADPTNQGSFEETVLHMAAGSCKETGQEIIEILVNSGMDINIRDKNNRTPLHSAAVSMCGVNNIPLLIGLGADHKLVDINGETPLDLAIQVKNEDAINILRAYPNNP